MSFLDADYLVPTTPSTEDYESFSDEDSPITQESGEGELAAEWDRKDDEMFRVLRDAFRDCFRIREKRIDMEECEDLAHNAVENVREMLRARLLDDLDDLDDLLPGA